MTKAMKYIVFVQINLAGGYTWISSAGRISAQIQSLLSPHIERSFERKINDNLEISLDERYNLVAEIIYRADDRDDLGRKGLVLVMGCIFQRLYEPPSQSELKRGASFVLEMRRQLMEFSVAKESATELLGTLLKTIAELLSGTVGFGPIEDSGGPADTRLIPRPRPAPLRTWLRYIVLVQVVSAICLILILIVLLEPWNLSDGLVGSTNAAAVDNRSS